MYETGGMRRTHLRGHGNIIKRLLIHAGAFNLSLIMRKVLGRGTPRGFQGSPNALLISLQMLIRLLVAAAPRQSHQSPRQSHQSGTQPVTLMDSVTPFRLLRVCLNFGAPFLEIRSASGC
jgi:hypothetical protein